MDVVDVFEHRGEFFTVLQETTRSQTGVMTIAPGADAGPEERHEADQIIYVVEGEAAVRVGEKEHRARAGSLVDRKSTRLNSSHVSISYAVFCLKKIIVRRIFHQLLLSITLDLVIAASLTCTTFPSTQSTIPEITMYSQIPLLLHFL